MMNLAPAGGGSVGADPSALLGGAALGRGGGGVGQAWLPERHLRWEPPGQLDRSFVERREREGEGIFFLV